MRPVFRSGMALTAVAATMAYGMTPGVARAQVADPLAMTTDPADRAVMAEAASAIAGRSPDIARLDAVLAKLPRPTPLRGMVQTVRAGVLASAQATGPAVAAIEEALRLLPDDPRPKLVATGIYTFSGSPQRAADLLLQASRLAPEMTRHFDRYVVMALTGRLTEIGDRSRADRLNARLGEIGFSSGLAPERSTAALSRTREAMRMSPGAATDEAVNLVTTIGDLDDLLTLYIDRRYAPLWPRIAEWAGADLAAQSRRYLDELRGDWAAAADFDTATPYARRLSRLEAYPAVVSLFLPMFDAIDTGAAVPAEARAAGAPRGEGVFLAPIVARALAHQGRYDEARALLARVATTVPADDQGNGLNLDGAYLQLAAMETDWPQVLTRADVFLDRAKRYGSNVNRASVLLVKAWQACALARTGQSAAAEPVTAEVLLDEALVPGAAMQMYVCRGDQAAARALVIRRLADETTRDWALRYVQPTGSATTTPLDRLTDPVDDAVRTAPDVVAAATRVGRILPNPVSVGLPQGFDPFRLQPRTTPLDANAV